MSRRIALALVMVVALVVGYIPQALGWWSWQVSLGAGFVVLALVLMIFGRNPEPVEEPDPNADLPGESGSAWSPLPSGTEPPTRREPLASGLDEVGRVPHDARDTRSKGADTGAR